MNRTTRHMAEVAILGLLAACTTTSNPKPTAPLGDSAYSFHDTRLQYALLTDDRRMLQAEFSIITEPTWAQRIAAAFAFPVTAATETAMWPAANAFRAFYENEGR